MVIRLNSFKRPYLVLSVTVWFTAFLLFPALATAGLSGSVLSNPASVVRDAQLDKIRQVLESKVAVQKLKDFGLTSAEISDKMSAMTDEQVHYLASLSDHVTAGGDGIAAAIGILVIVFLIILILKLSDKKIVIQ